MKIKLELESNFVKVILAALGVLQYNQVRQIIDAIETQLESQNVDLAAL